MYTEHKKEKKRLNFGKGDDKKAIDERFKKAYFDELDDDSDDDHNATNLEVNTMVSIKAGCCTFNPVTPTGRKLHQMQMILLPFIPIAALIIQNCYAVAHIIYFQQDVRELQMQVDSAVEMGTVLTALQQERVEVAYYIFSNGTRLTRNTSETGTYKKQTALEETFKLTDHAIEEVHIWPDFAIFDAAQVLGSKLMFQIRLEDLRETININTDDADTVKNKVNYYTRISAHIMEAIIKSIKDTNLSNIWKLMIAYKDMIRAVEYFGITMVEGLNFFGEGSLNRHTYINFVTHDALAWKTLNQTKDFVTIIRKKIDNMTHQYENIENVFQWRARITENVAQAVDLREADDYYYVMVRLSDELRDMQQFLLELIKDYMRQELDSADTKAALSILLLTLVLCLSPIIIFLIRNASITIQACAVSLTTKTNQLKKEKRRCDRLLCQMLPPPVAQQLKKRQSVPAESYDMVTVYFSDIVGFTKLAADSSPMQIVALLNTLYSMFDTRIEKFDVYKVETIGDAYMVVSGVPQPIGTRHVTEIAHMALDLLDSVSQFVIPHRPDKQLLIRAGFNSGPAVAGVVGTSMPRYCIFGDTVNIASKMEATGEAMKVNISQMSKELLEHIGGFSFELHDYHEVKGKGVIPTFWLTACPEYKKETENKEKKLSTALAPPVTTKKS